MKEDTNSQKISPTALHRLTSILQHRYDEMLQRRFGVGFAQVQIMEVLSGTFPRSQRFISLQLKQTEANVSRQLRLMQKQGVVNVKKNKKDSRVRDVVLTAEGRRIYEQAQKALQAYQEDLMRHLTKEDRKSFVRTVQNLLRAL